jgi:predicted peptidase
MTFQRLHICAIAHSYPNGSYLDTVAIQYSHSISRKSVKKTSFSVRGRKIKNAYTSQIPDRTECRTDGKYVVLELDPADRAARTSFVKFGKEKNPNPLLPPHMVRIKNPLTVCVRQKKDLMDLRGNICEAAEVGQISDRQKADTVDDFHAFVFQHLKYNLYQPDKQEYPLPLVIFLHDASACGNDSSLTLLQGNGAVSFASKENQKKHPCFVLAPQISEGDILATDDYQVSPTVDKIKKLIDAVLKKYPVDLSRIYITGQSMGCMAACELTVRYPSFFAASLLIAGKWDPARMALLKDPAMWIFVSQADEKAFPGMNEVVKTMEKAGTHVAYDITKRFSYGAVLPLPISMKAVFLKAVLVYPQPM